jgi:hypothetical protein
MYNGQRYFDAYKEAEKRVKAKMDFYWHLASYIVVNGFLIGIYLMTCWNGDAWNWYYPWFIWPLGGWGVGLMFNFLAVYVFPDNGVTRQKMVDSEMQRMGVPTPDYRPTINYTPSGQLNPQPEPPIPEQKMVEHK